MNAANTRRLDTALCVTGAALIAAATSIAVLVTHAAGAVLIVAVAAVLLSVEASL